MVKTVTVAEVQTWVPLAKEAARILGLVVKDLMPEEIKLFTRSFNRQFLLPYAQRQIADIYLRHGAEILLGAMMAKEQFDQELGGERPPAGKFGMVVIRPAYFGLRDWDEVGTITGASPQNWIHSGSALLGGKAGEPITIEENAAHMVVGVGSLHPSPKIESFQFTIDGKKKPVSVSWYGFGLGTKDSALHIKEFDMAWPFKEDTTVLVKTYQRVTAIDIPFLFGASFIKEPQLRLHDPASVVVAAEKVLRFVT